MNVHLIVTILGVMSIILGIASIAISISTLIAIIREDRNLMRG